MPSHPSVFTLLQFERWQGQKGQTSEPKKIFLSGSASAGQSEGSFCKCLFSSAPASSCTGDASLKDSGQVTEACWLSLGIFEKCRAPAALPCMLPIPTDGEHPCNEMVACVSPERGTGSARLRVSSCSLPGLFLGSSAQLPSSQGSASGSAPGRGSPGGRHWLCFQAAAAFGKHHLGLGSKAGCC